MAIAATCPACGKVKNVPEEIAGKRIKCSGCGGTVAVPLAASAQPGGNQPSSAEGPANAEFDFTGDAKAKGPRKKAKKKAKGPSKPVRLLLILALPVLALLVLGGCLAGVFFWWTSEDEPFEATKARWVDVHSVFKGKSVGYDNMLVLVRDHPEGSHLFVELRLPGSLQKQRRAEEGGGYSIQIGARDVVLKVPGESRPVLPLFLVNVGDKSGMKLYQDVPKGTTYGKWLDENLPEPNSPWTHEGELKEDGTYFEFKGKRGMRAKVSYAELDVSEQTVTWDESSRAWSGSPDVFSLPVGLLARTQTIHMVYPRPPVTEGLVLQALGQEFPLKVE
jgi:hypothetical protein